jgi:hypothetical protein
MQSHLIDEFTEGTKSSYGVYEESNSVKLFVFGDSYADTGNFLSSVSYKPPYGNTFPGKPSGRFSDGRILTDYVGNFRSTTRSLSLNFKLAKTLENKIYKIAPFNLFIFLVESAF